MKYLLLLFLAYCAYSQCPNAGYSEWTGWSPEDPAESTSPGWSCSGRCGTGKVEQTRMRTCCRGKGNCEESTFATNGDIKETRSNHTDCQLDQECKDQDGRREYIGFFCKNREYLGLAGSPGACQDLQEASNVGSKMNGYMLECWDSVTTKKASCYACKTESVSNSDCGSRVYLEPVYDWNYAITGLGLGVAAFIVLGSFLIHMMWGEDEEVVKEEEDEAKKRDPLNIDPGDGKMCSFCPIWFDLATGTTALCFCGFAMGALLNIAFDEASSKQKSDWLELIYYPGELWINILKMIVTPMIALMMLSLPDRVNILKSKIGGHLFAFYVFTSAVAACEGLIWVNLIQPGDVNLFLVPADKSVDSDLTELDALLGIGRKAFPKSIFAALADGNILGVIVFFLTLGIFIQSDSVPARWRDNLMQVTKVALKGIMLTIPMIIKFTPVAMFCIVTNKIAGVDNLQLLLQTEAYYLLTAVIGQGVHAMLFYPLVLAVATGMSVNGWSYFLSVKKAPFTAFATSSSAATLPVTIETTRTAGISPLIVDFVAPVGSAINMDGTSLGFPIMVLFTAQLIDEKLDFGTQITIALLAMTCSIGTAPIPNAGLVYITMLFTAAGGRLADDDVIALGLAMIVILDWFIDRVETAQNVWSDCVACKLFDYWGYQNELSRVGDEAEMSKMDDEKTAADTHSMDVEDESEKRTPKRGAE